MLIVLVIFSQVKFEKPVNFISHICILLQYSLTLCTLVKSIVCFLQYLVHFVKPGKDILDRFAVLFSVVVVWIFAHILTVGGAYNDSPPKTQTSCRTDRAGLIDAAPW